jgi:site-specific recombinase XerC
MTDLIDAYLAHCEADGGLATTTIETKRTVLEMFDRELPLGLEHALEHELIGIIGRKTPDGQPRYKVRTKFVYTIHLKEFFKYSSDPRRPAHLRLTYDPAEGLSIPRVPRGVPRPLSDEQCQKILTEAREPYRTWAEIALLTGMRCCEIAGIDLDKGDITERRVTSARAKGRSPGRSRRSANCGNWSGACPAVRSPAGGTAYRSTPTTSRPDRRCTSGAHSNWNRTRSGPSACTAAGTRSPRTCSRPASTSGRSRYCSATTR